MARNEVCSSPVHDPITVSVPPIGPVVGVTTAVGAGIDVPADGAAVGVALMAVGDGVLVEELQAETTTTIGTSTASSRRRVDLLDAIESSLPGENLPARLPWNLTSGSRTACPTSFHPGIGLSR